MAEGLDYSYGRPSIPQMKAAHIGFVIRYLSQGGKGLTNPEASQLHAAGIDIGLVYESGATTALGGWSAGVQDAHVATSLAEALGIPKTVAIYYAVDWDASTSQLDAVKAYFVGINSVSSYKVGVYGSNRVIAAVQADYQWATYAWSDGAAAPAGTEIRQYDNDITLYGAAVDRDKELLSGWGQWYAPGNSPKPPVSNDLLAWAVSNPSVFKAAVASGLHD